MAEIKFVNKIDNLVFLKNIIVSCTNKDGLLSNKKKSGGLIEGIPENGLLGFIAEKNKDVLFLSTGESYKLINDAGLNVQEISDYTGYPEMKTGLVKSLHPKIHAGILAHKYTLEDAQFIEEHNIKYIDAIIINFYDLQATLNNKNSTIEMIRQAIDIGGPSMGHNARKAFISTALITEPDHYCKLIAELAKYNGAVSLEMRIELAKLASTRITEYLIKVDAAIQQLEIQDVLNSYQVQV
ncbi:hypothetical protein ACFQI7_32700 [Paenibacillus allorhizosphaerae]|uniref:Bifunctional purine biosynthesis protein PurH n=1 Tax=Paenibacillus allorhizosphaerae TaxID=2849866 RepID=A0ABN7TYW5_9BACL|nr:hypothetical protein [Paenibacillus allorhizosphaerae]CAG7659181.1 Bifunctional purine biosynthesis protein PurH [Paenibacillus allorhizosphaerae]